MTSSQIFARTQRLSSFEWLVRLRWLAIGGQALTLCAAAKWLQLPLELSVLIPVFLFTAVTNILLHRLPERLRCRQESLQITLVTDVLLLTLLLSFSGGPENPFSILYLLHVVLAAVLLDRRWALIVSGLSIALFAALFAWSAPFPPMSHSHGSAEGVLNVHLLGMWIAFSLVALISAYCVSRIAEELRRRERESERLTLRQRQLASLTTLAAGAAHELSTPLGTMAIAIGELELGLRKIPGASLLVEDVELVRSQIDRCKDIISRMSGCSGEVSAHDAGGTPLARFSETVSILLHERFGERVQVDTGVPSDSPIPQSSALHQAIIALTKNAVEASPAEAVVKVRLGAAEGIWRARVTDSGHGMREEILHRLGEPFFTTKKEGVGMGLGVFLARLTADSLGGSLTYSSSIGRGTEAELSIPLREAHGAP